MKKSIPESRKSIIRTTSMKIFLSWQESDRAYNEVGKVSSILFTVSLYVLLSEEF